MFRWLCSKKGQNTAEYAILIGVIVAAAIAMQIYVRRGMQARIKDAVDYSRTAAQEENNAVFTNMLQYEPYYMCSTLETVQHGNTSEALQEGGGVVRDSIFTATQRTGNQIYANYATANE